MAKKRGRKKKSDKYSNISAAKKEFSIYQRGAVLGALGGGVVGLILGRRILLCILGGAFLGGYISYQINKDGDVSPLKAEISK